MEKGYFNRFFILCFMICSTFIISAQDHKVSISVGPTFPQRELAETTLDSSLLMKGFAKTGIHFNFAYTFNFANNFGITGAFFGNSNPVNMSKYNKEYQRVITNEIPLLKDVAFSHNSENKTWMTGAILAGPNINFYLARHFYLEIRCLLGIGFGTSPEIKNVMTYEDYTFSYKQRSDHTQAFAWNLGAGLNYRFDQIFVRANFDYFTSNMKFKNIEYQFTSSESLYHVNNISNTLEIINNQLQLSFGIGYCF